MSRRYYLVSNSRSMQTIPDILGFAMSAHKLTPTKDTVKIISGVAIRTEVGA
jgi:hypothetical protein